jgi:hypothetical protein
MRHVASQSDGGPHSDTILPPSWLQPCFSVQPLYRTAIDRFGANAPGKAVLEELGNRRSRGPCGGAHLRSSCRDARNVRRNLERCRWKRGRRQAYLQIRHVLTHWRWQSVDGHVFPHLSGPNTSALSWPRVLAIFRPQLQRGRRCGQSLSVVAKQLLEQRCDGVWPVGRASAPMVLASEWATSAFGRPCVPRSGRRAFR